MVSLSLLRVANYHIDAGAALQPLLAERGAGAGATAAARTHANYRDDV